MIRMLLGLWLLTAACGGLKSAGETCSQQTPGECASGVCVSITCNASGQVKVVCTAGRCDTTACIGENECVLFPSTSRHCVPAARVCQ